MKTVETKNLFGETIKIPVRGKHYVQPKGYAAPPGSGPKGKTCADCENIQRDRNWAKCALARHSGCRATDILLRSPSCRFFEESTKDE
jgi:CRISPR/Cas system CSM-associated protein Csm3 (group 7 of RAMP superfamily)